MPVKPFVENICCDVFRRSVVVICGSREETRPLYDRMASRFVPKKIRDGIWSALCDAWDKAREESPMCKAITTCEHGDAYVIMPEWNLSVFAHETYHAVQVVMREVGASDEELGAYLTEYIFGAVVETAQKASKEKK